MRCLHWALGPVLAVSVVLGSGCDEAPPESPPPETTAPEGVFGQAPAAVSGINSVLTLHTATPLDIGAGEESPVMDQLGLAFSPPELFVRVGQRMVFTNSETLPHNVHVHALDGDSTVFNTDTGPAQRVDFVFEREGGYDVVCDIHPGMRALIYATSTPYAAFANDEGYFLFLGVPPGAYTLSVWSLDPELRSEQPIEVSAESTEVEIGPLR